MSKRDRIAWDEQAEAWKSVRQHLPPLVADYFVQGRDLVNGKAAAPKLHSFRLATKRLRYSLELFRPCYGSGLSARLANLRELQQVLGDINDAEVAERALRDALGAKSPQTARLVKFLRARAETKTGEFRKQWKEEFDAPGQERWWTNYLARNSRRPRKG
jgi:CHAD domain-containing protein